LYNVVQIALQTHSESVRILKNSFVDIDRRQTNMAQNGNLVAVICKTVGVIIFATVFIGGILIGVEEVAVTPWRTDTRMNWRLVFTIWTSGFISGLLFIAIGEIISLLQNISDNSRYTEKHILTSKSTDNDESNRVDLDESLPMI